MQDEARKLQDRSAGQRYLQLDALRGIAAVCVVFHHLRLAFHDSSPPLWAMPIFSGTQAVMLFFVLSGFVLSLPYLGTKRRPYGPYLVRRFWRIYVPFAAAVALSAAGALLFQGKQQPLTFWYTHTWQTPVTVWLLVQQLLMVPTNELNTAFWSLSIEVQLSLVMPFLAVAIKRMPAWASLALLLVWLQSAKWVQNMQPAFWPFLPFCQFGPLFLIGGLLAKYREMLTQAVRRLGRWQWVFLLVSFVVYCNFRSTKWPLYIFLEYHQPWVSGAGAAGIILYSLSSERFARLLEHRLPEYLGRISYSLYLTHSIVLFSSLDLLYGRVPHPVLVLIVLAGALAMGHLFCVAVEEPAMRMGKRLGDPARGAGPGTPIMQSTL